MILSVVILVVLIGSFAAVLISNSRRSKNKDGARRSAVPYDLDTSYTISKHHSKGEIHDAHDDTPDFSHHDGVDSVDVD